MSDDWQVGDRAVCVDARPNGRLGGPCPLVEGRIYCVTGISPSNGAYDNHLYPICVGLFLDGLTANSVTGAFAEPRFRKIRPDEPKACEAEFVILLKLSKQRVKEALKIGER